MLVLRLGWCFWRCGFWFRVVISERLWVCYRLLALWFDFLVIRLGGFVACGCEHGF